MSDYRRFSLAFDCDGVIVSSSTVILDVYNQSYGTTVGLNQDGITCTECRVDNVNLQWRRP